MPNRIHASGLVAALVVTLGGFPLEANAQEAPGATAVPPPRTVTVSASGRVEAEPDQAVLTLAVETVGETAREALASNAERADALITALTDLGLAREKVGTVSFGLNPEYARPEAGAPRQEPRIVGYRAHNTLRVVVDELTRAGEVIDAAAAAGANRIGGPSFGIADAGPLRLRALADAVEKARAEASVLAAALGMDLGDVMKVDTSAPGGPIPMPQARTLALEAVQTPIEPGTLSIGATVRITWELRAR
ncbi:MAG: SIMPL domain-containing protein [Gemmatimonadota bacterium]